MEKMLLKRNEPADEFVAEVKKRLPKTHKLSAAALSRVRQEYAEHAPPTQARRAEALILERRLSDLVNAAYGLTPEEIDLMWRTAPPRMPGLTMRSSVGIDNH